MDSEKRTKRIAKEIEAEVKAYSEAKNVSMEVAARRVKKKKGSLAGNDPFLIDYRCAWMDVELKIMKSMRK